MLRLRPIPMLALTLGLAFQAAAEELELTKAKTIDWSREDQGGVQAARALLAPTADPKELSEELKRGNGVRLSSEDDVHVVVVALGPLAAGTTYALTQTQIDRFSHLVELTFEIGKPPRDASDAKAAETKKKDEEELIIAPAAAPPPKVVPQSITGTVAGNTAIFLPAGKLEYGTWYLRVKTIFKDGGKRTELPVKTDTFLIKDNRPMTKADKGRNTPEVGLQRPTSHSVTEGMGGQ
ncbi:MAG: hypothetical protein HY291_15770 [Planctomycetes bacterium]|nr:hypothetical protein [Planctomycetota bacterium]